MEVLKTTFALQKDKRFWNDLMRPGLTKSDVFPIKGNSEYSCFLGTVDMTGFWLYNLYINFEMHLSINLLEYPLNKSISLSFSISKWNLDTSETSKKEWCKSA